MVGVVILPRLLPLFVLVLWERSTGAREIIRRKDRESDNSLSASVRTALVDNILPQPFGSAQRPEPEKAGG